MPRRCCGVVVRVPGEHEGRVVDVSPLLHREGDGRDLVETAALRMLDDAQDEVIETLRVAWPSDGSRAAPASAYAEWVEGGLSTGYRYDSGALVAFELVAAAQLW